MHSKILGQSSEISAAETHAPILDHFSIHSQSPQTSVTEKSAAATDITFTNCQSSKKSKRTRKSKRDTKGANSDNLITFIHYEPPQTSDAGCNFPMQTDMFANQHTSTDSDDDNDLQVVDILDSSEIPVNMDSSFQLRTFAGQELCLRGFLHSKHWKPLKEMAPHQIIDFESFVPKFLFVVAPNSLEQDNSRNTEPNIGVESSASYHPYADKRYWYRKIMNQAGNLNAENGYRSFEFSKLLRTQLSEYNLNKLARLMSRGYRPRFFNLELRCIGPHSKGLLQTPYPRDTLLNWSTSKIMKSIGGSVKRAITMSPGLRYGLENLFQLFFPENVLRYSHHDAYTDTCKTIRMILLAERLMNMTHAT